MCSIEMTELVELIFGTEATVGLFYTVFSRIRVYLKTLTSFWILVVISELSRFVPLFATKNVDRRSVFNLFRPRLSRRATTALVYNTLAVTKIVARFVCDGCDSCFQFSVGVVRLMKLLTRRFFNARCSWRMS